MRYRSFGRSGQAISALQLGLDDENLRPADMVNLVLGALEAGINGFEARYNNTAAVHAIGQGVSALDRKLVVVGLRVPPPPDGDVRNLSRDGVVRILQDALRNTGLRWIDYLIIEDPQPGEISAAFLVTIEAARQAKRLRYVGVSGDSLVIDDIIERNSVQIYAARYNLRSSAQTRTRIRMAIHGGMIVLGQDYHPRIIREGGYRDMPDAAPRKSGGLLSLVSGRPKTITVERARPYAFLDRVRGWAADAVCLAYALNEPALSSIRISPTRLDDLAALAETVERDMPTGVAAQIELARVADLD